MSRITKVLLGLMAVAIGLGIINYIVVAQLRSPQRAIPDENLGAPVASQPAPPLPGEPILLNYASPSIRPQEDLSMMAHAFSNLFLLIKGEPSRLSANEEFAAALRGKNPAQIRFVPDNHPAFNAAGQLVDRWQTPLFFHAVGHGRLDIRSAGSDREMWTDDDLHRRYDGQFLTGADLRARSLFEEAAAAPGRKAR